MNTFNQGDLIKVKNDYLWIFPECKGIGIFIRFSSQKDFTISKEYPLVFFNNKFVRFLHMNEIEKL